MHSVARQRHVGALERCDVGAVMGSREGGLESGSDRKDGLLLKMLCCFDATPSQKEVRFWAATFGL